MKIQFGVSAALAALGALMLSTNTPAQAQQFGLGSLGWNGNGNGGGRHHHHNNGGVSGGGSTNSAYGGYGNGAYGYNNGMAGNGYNTGGFGNLIGNNGNGSFNGGTNNRGLLRQESRLAGEQQNIQNRLASGNLSAAQAARLQSRLAQVQSQETGLNGSLSNQFGSQQSQIQQLLSSGTLNPMQTASLQNRLMALQNQQGAINSNSPGLMNNVRNWFKGH